MNAVVDVVTTLASAVAAVAALLAVKVAVAEAQASRRERRLEHISAAIAFLEDLRGQLVQGSQSALVRFPSALADIGAAAHATGLTLPACERLGQAPIDGASPDLIAAARNEVSEALAKN